MRQMSDKLTTKQKEVLLYMQDFWLREGYPPSFQEIADGLFIAKTTAFAYVKKLEEKGYIQTQERKTRAIRFLKGVNEA